MENSKFLEDDYDLVSISLTRDQVADIVLALDHCLYCSEYAKAEGGMSSALLLLLRQLENQGLL